MLNIYTESVISTEKLQIRTHHEVETHIFPLRSGHSKWMWNSAPLNPNTCSRHYLHLTCRSPGATCPPGAWRSQPGGASRAGCPCVKADSSAGWVWWWSAAVPCGSDICPRKALLSLCTRLWTHGAVRLLSSLHGLINNQIIQSRQSRTEMFFVQTQSFILT